MFDIIYNQKQNEVEGRFDLLAGLKFVYQNVYDSGQVTNKQFDDIKAFVEKSFEDGNETLLGKLHSITRNGAVDRLELADLIDRIETKQMDKEDPDSKEQENLNKVNYLHHKEEYSCDRDREVIGQIKSEIEECLEFSQRISFTMKVKFSENLVESGNKELG